MDEKKLEKQNKEYSKARNDYLKELTNRDRLLYSETGTVKYNPKTGELKQEAK